MPDTKSAGARLFVAIFPPQSVVEALMAEIAKVASRGGAIRWTKPQQIHLTLNFLGHVEAGRVAEFARGVGAAAAEATRHSLEVVGLGTFPSAKRPRILWAGLGGEMGPLLALKLALDRRMQALGWVPEERDFHPHLTIGRARDMGARERAELAAFIDSHASWRFGAWPVERVALMRRSLLPGGAQYSVECSFDLPKSRATPA